MKQLDLKDKADEYSRLLGERFQEIRQKVEANAYNRLLKDSEKSIDNWYKSKMAQKQVFENETNKILKDGLKSVKQDLNNIKQDNIITKQQVNDIKDEINKNMNLLKNFSTGMYVKNAIELKDVEIKTNTDDLFTLIFNKMNSVADKGDYGVVDVGGKKYKWESYVERQVRTQIQTKVSQNMIATGNEYGVVFYICVCYGDCAKDHQDYQGKIYYDKDWRANVSNEEVANQVQEYIDFHNLMSVQDVTMDSPYLTTRPNCRHYFQYISIDDVLTIKNDKDLNLKRDELNLNLKETPKKDAYKYLNKQRYNERNIKQWKEQLEKAQALYDTRKPNGRQALMCAVRIRYCKDKVAEWQLKQRKLIKDNKFLQREYNREKVNDFYDLGITTKEKAVEEIKIDVDPYKLTNNDFPIQFFENEKKSKSTRLFVDAINNKITKDNCHLYDLFKYGIIDYGKRKFNVGLEVNFTNTSPQLTIYTYISDGKLSKLNINLLDLKKYELGLRINIHEIVHLIDTQLYVKKSNSQNATMFSKNRIDEFNTIVKDFVENDEFNKLINEFREKETKIKAKCQEVYDKQYIELKEKFENGKIVWSTYDRKNKDIVNEYGMNINANINDYGYVFDILDAATSGKIKDEYKLFGHGKKYYSYDGGERKVSESVANYVALKICNPEMIERLKKISPEIESYLDKLTREMVDEVKK